MTPLPLKIIYATPDEYRRHFERVYCRGPIITFDGIPVWFRKQDFDHCMYESSHRNRVKDVFSRDRAERIDWIGSTLINPRAELYQGWDKKRHHIDSNYRVAVTYETFVVIIRVWLVGKGQLKADFITAFLADNSIGKIKAMPKWDKNKCR